MTSNAQGESLVFPVRQRRHGLTRRLDYYRRTLSAYVLRRPSHLTFWHDVPEVNGPIRPGELGPYYMTFRKKADYAGPYDRAGIPLLDYRGRIGRQYNPIAIAQYGLGNDNLYRKTGDGRRRARFLVVADWLTENLEENGAGLPVWHHHFDWVYRTPLKAPWYSALAQGQGLSVLVRAGRETGAERYLEAARRAFPAFLRQIEEGGVSYRDGAGYTWFEEVVTEPPTHILNGFIWAAWGVYDFALATASREARQLFDEAVGTLRDNLPRFDTGYWSLYELSGTRLKMLASPFYHRLHTVQLRVMHGLTAEPVFLEYARRWEGYRARPVNRTRALAQKALFKLLYY